LAVKGWPAGWTDTPQRERGIEMPHSLRKTNTTLWIVLAVLTLVAIAIIIAVTMSGGGGGGGGY
jgi:hypothetical protein